MTNPSSLMIDDMRPPSKVSLHGSRKVLDAMGKESFQEKLIEMYESALDAVVYRIDNVAEYFVARFEQGSYPDYLEFVEDLPCIAPVNSVSWMEFRNTFDDLYDVNIEKGYTVPDRLGILVRIGYENPDAHTDSSERWLMELKLFASNPDGQSFYFFGETAMILNSTGGLARWLLPIHPCEDMGKVSMWTSPALLALSFMHCKNVVINEHSGLYANRQDRRQAERRGDPPRSTFHTLQIEPMKKVLATEGGIATNGLKKALHICRGHFSEYGDEYGKGKLFGKLEGRYWMPAHVRGSSEVGIADKDYNVKAPRNQTT
jgi:hypothetical protein